MATGAITEYIDVAQLALYGFWIFFAGLVVYLQREGMREGYPLESEVAGRTEYGLFPQPDPKSFKLHDGRVIVVPQPEAPRDLKAVQVDGWPGSPWEPSGDPMADGVGPASYAMRENVPELTLEGQPLIVPLRIETTFAIATEDADPRGMEVVGADGLVAGTVADCWVDRAEPQIRYLEVALPAAAGVRHVLLPMTMARVVVRHPIAITDFLLAKRQPGSFSAQGRVHVKSILAAQFAGVPATASGDQITKLEEEKITGYFAAGTLYAEPARQEPFL
jgi:photosynthetic reaction center H subunit